MIGSCCFRCSGGVSFIGTENPQSYPGRYAIGQTQELSGNVQKKQR
jgi:hypothetical protein